MKNSTLEIVIILDSIVSGASLLITFIYSPIAKTWTRALGVVFVVASISMIIGIKEIMLAADGKQNILAVVSFPITSLIIAAIIRSIRLAIFPIKKKLKEIETKA